MNTNILSEHLNRTHAVLEYQRKIIEQLEIRNAALQAQLNRLQTAAYAEGRADQLEEDRAKIDALKSELEALQRAFSAQYQADAIASANSGTDAINVRF